MNEDRLIEILFDELPKVMSKIKKLSYLNVSYVLYGSSFVFSNAYLGGDTGNLWKKEDFKTFLVSNYKKHWGTLEVGND